MLLLLAVVTVALARWASADAWRAELVPLMLFGMTMAIVYRQELALLLSGVLALDRGRWPSGHGLPAVPAALRRDGRRRAAAWAASAAAAS